MERRAALEMGSVLIDSLAIAQIPSQLGFTVENSLNGSVMVLARNAHDD